MNQLSSQRSYTARRKTLFDDKDGMIAMLQQEGVGKSSSEDSKEDIEDFQSVDLDAESSNERRNS